MQLFYNKNLHKESTFLTFDKEESRHIISVLRKKEGDVLMITNGNHLLFKAKIRVANNKRCQVQIVAVTEKESPRKYNLSIAIAPTKSNDRLEWFLEKATEIGVDEVCPILCKHSERKTIKTARLAKVLLSAMKQSLQYKLPVLQELASFKDCVLKDFKGQKFIAYCQESSTKTLQSQIKKDTNILILIGPEGGFSSNEIEMALENNFIPVSLGANRLRTETAGIVATHTVSLANNN